MNRLPSVQPGFPSPSTRAWWSSFLGSLYVTSSLDSSSRRFVAFLLRCFSLFLNGATHLTRSAYLCTVSVTFAFFALTAGQGQVERNQLRLLPLILIPNILVYNCFSSATAIEERWFGVSTDFLKTKKIWKWELSLQETGGKLKRVVLHGTIWSNFR